MPLGRLGVMERWDVFDANRQPLGRTVERCNWLPPGEYHTVIHVCLINEEGEMLIQKRTDDKQGFPGKWDFTAGGSVMAGETNGEGAQRELFEELGIRLDLADRRPEFTFNFEYGFDDFYVVTGGVELEELAVPNREVAAVKWASEEEVIAMLRSGEFIAYREAVVRFVFDFVGQTNIFADITGWSH